MNISQFALTNKLALITGGGKGLGFGIARAFSEAGAEIVLTDRNEEVLVTACKDLNGKVVYIVNDITELELIPSLVNEIETKHGPVDILVNNAGIHIKKHIKDMTDEDFEKVIRTNLSGVYSLSREIGKKMMERNSGSIINITSMAAIYGIPHVSAYSASKTGVLGLTRALAEDLSPYGIRVNAIAPGFINSDMSRKAFESDPERLEKVLSRTPLRKLGSSDDVANAAVFLASEASRFITGVNLPVDGGNSIGF